ncbi:MAG: hypothetical protein ACI4X9_05560 [Kiritimatiellia bacterium]
MSSLYKVNKGWLDGENSVAPDETGGGRKGMVGAETGRIVARQVLERKV